jgi:hypothetical protein
MTPPFEDFSDQTNLPVKDLGLLNAGDFTGRFDKRNENNSEEMLAVLIRQISPAAVPRRAAWPLAWA